MKLLFGKGMAIQDNIFKYLDLIKKTRDRFFEIITNYLKDNKVKQLLEETRKVHSLESKADDLIRDIEKALYSKILLPEFRGDIIQLLNILDKIPNECQTILYMIGTQNLKIPSVLKNKVSELIEVNLKAIDEVIALNKMLFENPKGVEKHVKEIDSLESHSDAVERELIIQIFSTKSIEKYEKLLLKELIVHIGSLSDYPENTYDMVTIINLKTRV